MEVHGEPETKTTANKAYKFRLYPTAEQKVLFAKTFGCVRFIYNKMLADKIAYYEKTGKTLYNTPASYKREFEWLKEVDSLALCNAQLQLQKAYNDFFANSAVGFPEFRSKRNSRKAYTTNRIQNNIRIEHKYLKLPKVGLVRIVQHREIPRTHIIKSVTVSQEPSGKYYAAILTEYQVEPAERTLDMDKAVGLGYSSPYFYVDSDGHSANMSNFCHKAERRLAQEKRKLSKMVRGSANYQKQQVRIARISEKLRNAQKDWQHKESTRLVRSYDYICVARIDYENRKPGTKPAKWSNHNSFGQFRGFLDYKMADQGKKLITIGKWMLPSKTCRHCGYVNTALTQEDNSWVCPSCGEVIARDYNAAVNIREAGLSILST